MFSNRRKENWENILAIKDCNGGLITDPVDNANVLNHYYASVFCSEQDIRDIISTHSDKPSTIKITIIRKRLGMIGRNKLVGPDGIPGTILKMGGETMILYLARLPDIIINNVTTPRDWKNATVSPIHKGDDRSVVKNYKPVTLTSAVCKQMEHVITVYIRQA
jgi:hypothetical protein